jgi:tetratricopeptide (TPR) repeat protein
MLGRQFHGTIGIVQPSPTSFVLALVLIAGASCAAHAASDYDAFIAQGNALLQAGNADQALNSGEAAIKISADRWEGHALAGGALMNLKRYEDAADALSKAIDRAPESKQPALRDQRRQCLLAESGYPAVTNSSVPASTGRAEIVLWKSIENSHAAADFHNYLSQYPNGAYVELARSHLADTEAQLESERKRLVAKLTWTDPATGLMWAKYSRPSEYAHANFTRATEYCAALRSLGYADWRLSTVGEFMRIYHFAADSATVQLDGELATNKDILRYLGFWTSTPGNQDGEHDLVFEGKSVSSRNNDGAGRVGGWLGGHPWNGAIVCVRDQTGAPDDAERRRPTK